jgi:malate dehydrogenase (oxaloacetate-decarboxylating)(NADP+)
MERKGVAPDTARTIVRTNSTVIAALMVARGDADAMICGTYGEYQWHQRYLADILGLAKDVHKMTALSLIILEDGPIFIADTYIAEDPDAEEIADLTIRAAQKVSDFGIAPKVALVAASNFGARPTAASRKMRRALKLILAERPDLEVEGEMQANTALNEDLRMRIFPNSRLKGRANLLIMPTLEAANSGFNLVRTMAHGLHVGPMQARAYHHQLRDRARPCEPRGACGDRCAGGGVAWRRRAPRPGRARRATAFLRARSARCVVRSRSTRAISRCAAFCI